MRRPQDNNETNYIYAVFIPGETPHENMIKFLYRGDSRNRWDIFDKGFKAKGTCKDIFMHVIESSEHSAYISTTTSKPMAVDFSIPISEGYTRGFVFVIKPQKTAVDVKPLVDHWLATDRIDWDTAENRYEEKEFSALEKIKSQDIKGAWEVELVATDRYGRELSTLPENHIKHFWEDYEYFFEKKINAEFIPNPYYRDNLKIVTKGAHVVGHVATAAAATVDGIRLIEAYHEGKQHSNFEKFFRKSAEVVGGWTSAFAVGSLGARMGVSAGAKVGHKIGSSLGTRVGLFAGPWGMVIGNIVGGAVGSYIGYVLGEKVAGDAYDFVTDPSFSITDTFFVKNLAYAANPLQELEISYGALLDHPESEPLQFFIQNQGSYQTQLDVVIAANTAFRTMAKIVNNDSDAFSEQWVALFCNYYSEFYESISNWQALGASEFIPVKTFQESATELSQTLSQHGINGDAIHNPSMYLQLLENSRRVNTEVKLLKSYEKPQELLLDRELQKRIDFLKSIHMSVALFTQSVVDHFFAFGVINQETHQLRQFAEQMTVDEELLFPVAHASQFYTNWQAMGDDPRFSLFKMLEHIDRSELLDYPLLNLWNDIKTSSMVDVFVDSIDALVISDNAQDVLTESASRFSAGLLAAYIGNVVEPIECKRFGKLCHFVAAMNAEYPFISSWQHKVAEVMPTLHQLEQATLRHALSLPITAGSTHISIPHSVVLDVFSLEHAQQFVVGSPGSNPQDHVWLKDFLSAYAVVVDDMHNASEHYTVNWQSTFYKKCAALMSSLLHEHAPGLLVSACGKRLFDDLTQTGYTLKYGNPQQLDPRELTPIDWRSCADIHLDDMRPIDFPKRYSSTIEFFEAVNKNDKPIIDTRFQFLSGRPALQARVRDSHLSITANDKAAMLGIHFGEGNSVASTANKYKAASKGQNAAAIEGGPAIGATIGTATAVTAGGWALGPIGFLVGLGLGSLFGGRKKIKPAMQPELVQPAPDYDVPG